MKHSVIQINLPAAALSGDFVRPEYVGIPAAGERCPHTSLSRDAFYRLITRGALKPVKLGVGRGGRVLIRYEELVGAIRSTALPVQKFGPVGRKTVGVVSAESSQAD
jgi:hypothetical protein